MQVSTTYASPLLHPAAKQVPHRPSTAEAPTRSLDARPTPEGATFQLRALHHLPGLAERASDRAPAAHATDAGHDAELPPESSEAQAVRKRLATLEGMVTNRLEAFVERHDGDSTLAGDLEALGQDFHANLRSAYDAFRETGDRRALMHSVREAFSSVRAGFRFAAATLDAGGTPTVVVDPGPGVEDGPDGNESTVGSGSGTGGGTTVVGAPGSGVTVDVTPLEEAASSGNSGSGDPAGDLRAALEAFLASFGDSFGGLGELLGQGEGGSLKLTFQAEFQFGGPTLGQLLDALG